MCILKILVQDEETYNKVVENIDELSRIFGAPTSEFDIYHPDDCVLATIWSIKDVQGQPEHEDVCDEEARKLLLSLEDVMTETGNEILSNAEW